MMKDNLAGRLMRIVTIASIVCIGVSGADPVATLTSVDAFVMDGHEINTPGVRSFPVVVGDTISTTKGPALLVFKDGSTLKLEAGSSAQIGGTDAAPILILKGGAVDFNFAVGSKLLVDTVQGECKEIEPSGGGQTTGSVPGEKSIRKAFQTSATYERLLPNEGVCYFTKSGASGASGAVGRGLLTNPKFLIPAIAVAAGATAAGVLLTRPAASP